MLSRYRTGIAMIELIFAIVIMGIVLMSAPMLISNATKSNITAFQQESIAIVASHANALMSYAWDESNTLPNSSSFLLTTTAGNALLNEATRGAVATINRKRRYTPLGSDATAIGANAGDSDDVDDFNGININLTQYTAAQASNIGGYIDQNITIATAVAYHNDNPTGANNYNAAGQFTFNLPAVVGAAGITNIKRIRTTLTSVSPDAEIRNKQIILHAFMCNIGAARPLTDTF